MKRDKMTPAERLEALRKGEATDRVPFLSFALGFCAKNVGYPVSDIYADPEKSFRAQLRTRGQYGYDSEPFFGYASYGGWEFGGEIKLPDGEYEQAPSHGRFAVYDETDVEKLQRPDVKTAGMLPLAMQFSRIQEKNGIGPSVVVGGPLTISANICPVATLCRWMIKKPELVKRLLRLATDHILDIAHYWVNSFGRGRVEIQIWEPVATNDIISPKQFENLVLSYQVELYEKLMKMGILYVLYHICGEQNLNLPAWASVLMDNGIVSVGKEIDIDTAIKYFGDRCAIAGNIEPALLQTGTPDEIYELCRKSIEKGKRAPHGYALMPGCEVPVNTPPDNIYAMTAAVNEFGQYQKRSKISVHLKDKIK
jgi:uroporphyrinogen decarboxylase